VILLNDIVEVLAAPYLHVFPPWQSSMMSASNERRRCTWDHEQSVCSFEAPFEGGRILRERSADAPEPRKQGDDLSPENASEKNGGEGGIARGRRRSSSASLRTVAAALQRPAPMLCVGLLNLKIRTPSLRSAVEKPKGAQGPFCFSYVAERVGLSDILRNRLEMQAF
jgi:hypothetical protein